MADAQLNLKEAMIEGRPEGPIRTVAAQYGLPLGMRLSLVSEPAALLALENQWRALERDGNRAVFQSFDWLRSWLDHYGGRQDSPTPLVITGYRGQRLVFVWPLMKDRAGPFTILRWLTEPFAQYGDVLRARGECPSAWMADALLLIRKLPGIDAIRLRHVRTDAAAARFLSEAFRPARMEEQAPFLDLTQFASEADYDARYTAAQRKRRKKIRKSLEDAFGPVTFSLLRPGHAADEAMEQAVAEKCRWLEERGRQNRALGCGSIAPFLKTLSRAAPEHAHLVVSEVSAGGRPVSWEIGLRHNRTHFAFITSHILELTDYSPARLHMDFSQRQALRDGMTAFDLMHPNDPYKDSWCSGRTGVSDYHLPLSPAGWAYGGFYLERVRPLLREAYYRLPPRILRALKPIVRH